MLTNDHFQQFSSASLDMTKMDSSLHSVSLATNTDADHSGVLDLSSQDLSKLMRAAPEWTLNTTTMILDDNNLQRLDNIHTYQCVEKLSVQNNRLIRMFQVAKLSHLKILNLSGNHITVMEGLKELKLLTWLSVSNNHIKSIDSLYQNVHLEHVDFSGNQISHIADLSYLKNLRVLLLHKNQISSLQGCEKFLPWGLTTLTLNDNQVSDLCEVSTLSHLHTLEQLTFANNPAIDQPQEESQQFDYRPYVINWCLSLRILDGIVVGAKESLKAEWMYSQSRGRNFQVGQHAQLTEFLLQVCPLHPGQDWQEDKKLNLILSKVQEHQQSLRENSPMTQSLVLSPRCNTLPRVHAESHMQTASFVAGPGQTSALSSGTSTPTATPTVIRRSSFGSPANPYTARANVRRSSRTSPSPIRRRTLTPTSARNVQSLELGSYNLALPRSLYGDDINGNSESIMTQSMDPSSLMGQMENGKDLMTASLDPSILMDSIVNHKGGSKRDAWAEPGGPQVSRPSSLFQQGQDVKDLYLQDLSDSELSQSLVYSRLQTRLNPVPESLNSPDIAPPSSLGLGRARDDPVRVYNRDLIMSSSTTSTTPSSKSGLPGSKGVGEPSGKPRNGYSSSSEGEQQPGGSSSGCKQRNDFEVDAKKSTSQGRKLIPMNKQVSDLKKQHNNIVKKSENSRKSRDDDFRHSADDEDEEVVDGGPHHDCESNRGESPDRRKNDQRHQMRKSRSARRSSSISSGMCDTISSPAPKTPKQEVRSVAKPNRSQNIRATPKHQSEKFSTHETSSPRSATLPSAARTGSATSRRLQETLATNSRVSSRPGSATNRPRSNTVNALTTSAISKASSAKGLRTPQASQAATTIQKTWKGHSTRNNDEKVQDLKDEVKNLRTEQHIRHLTKELNAAKVALDRERKLRSLQMDAIKVLWKEVQLMDEKTKSDSNDNATLPNRSFSAGRTRPSGLSGSKISSRASEHSIAKLMETLEATAGANLAKDRPTDNGSTYSSETATPATPACIMAQSMPPSLLQATTGPNPILPGSDQAVEALSRTCSNLQRQVEMLQTSLNGVLQFVTNFTSIDAQQQSQHRTRHSSTASTNQDSFCYFSGGPNSLPPVLTGALPQMNEDNHFRTYQASTDVFQVPYTECPPVAMSKSCDCLTQTEISAVLTPKAEQPPTSKDFQNFKRIDLSLESDSDAQNSDFHLIKSPRPQTLPGLKQEEEAITKIPGLAQLAGAVLLYSPKAPEQVKAFARTLVDDLITDTLSKQVNTEAPNNADKGSEETDISLSLAGEDEFEYSPDGKDVHCENHGGVDHLGVPAVEDEPSSHVDTDSLDDHIQAQK